MNMEHEYPTQRRTPNPGPSRPAPRRNSGKGGRYLKETPKKTSNNRQPNGKRRHRRKLNPRFVIMLATVLVFVIGIALIVRSCNKPSIVGRWNVDGNTYYRFEEDGTGFMESSVKDYAFTYAIDDNVLYIDFTDETGNDLSYTFELMKDTLFLTGGSGDERRTLALTRVG